MTKRTLCRRSILAGLAASAALPNAVWGNTSLSTLKMSLRDLATVIVSGELTSVALAQEIKAAVTANTDLNAFSTFDSKFLVDQAKSADKDLANGRVRGPLHGIPLILKDNINTVDLPTSGGTLSLVGNRPKANAPIADELFAAGGLLAGKANLHELSSGGTSANHVFGEVRNPYGLDLVPGGSSGGTAAAVAAGLVPAGLGTDTTGSVRVPAALCGVVGFRPSTGRYPSTGIVPLSSSFDTAGPIARYTDDIVLLDSILSGQPTNRSSRMAPSIRIGVAESLIESSSPEVSAVVEVALRLLSDAGITLIPVDFAPLRELHANVMGPGIDYEFPDVMEDYLSEHAPALDLQKLLDAIASPYVKQFTLARLERSIPLATYQAAVGERTTKLQSAWEDLVQSNQLDAIAFPTTPDVALPLVSDDDVMRGGETVLSWFYFSHTGLTSAGRRPGISLPAGLSSAGLPVGLELDGLPGRDEDLLAVAQTIETILPDMPGPT